MTEWRAFLVAIQFLTRWPIQLDQAPSAQERGASLLFYPLVGLLIGVALTGLLMLLQKGSLSIALQAAIVLSAWVMITGGLHLDGLADTVDAWIGGHGQREKTLHIMQDPACGPMAVLALNLLLLLKWSALLSVLGSSESYMGILLAPIGGRAAALWLFLTTPYVRPGGLGEQLARYLPRPTAWIVLSMVLLSTLLIGKSTAAIAMLSSMLVIWLSRHQMMQVLGGTTGDTAGALIESTELTILLSVVIASP